MQRAVFATDDKLLSMLFIPKFRDLDIEIGYVKGNLYCLEQYPNAFKLLKVSGYIYEVDEKGFKQDKRLGMYKHEFINKDKVKILKVSKVKNILSVLRKSKNITMIPFKAKDDMIVNEIKKSATVINKRYLVVV